MKVTQNISSVDARAGSSQVFSQYGVGFFIERGCTKKQESTYTTEFYWQYPKHIQVNSLPLFSFKQIPQNSPSREVRTGSVNKWNYTKYSPTNWLFSKVYSGYWTRVQNNINQYNFYFSRTRVIIYVPPVDTSQGSSSVRRQEFTNSNYNYYWNIYIHTNT